MPEPQVIQRYIKDEMTKIRETVDTLSPLARKIEKLDLGIKDVSIVERVLDKACIWMRRDLKEDETLNQVAQPLLAKLAEADIHITPRKDGLAYEDYAIIGRREWKLANGKVILALFVPMGEGARCRYQRTGVEMVDKYEIVCDEG